MGKSTFDIRGAIGEALYALRVNNGMSRAEVAARLGTSEPSIIRYETGQRVPTANTIAALSVVFEVSPDAFFPSKEIIQKALDSIKEKHGDSDKK